MKCTIPEISWHNRDPVLSVDVQPLKPTETFYRLATGGTDSHVLIWLLSVEKGGAASLECAADLTRHTRPVNCVRFSPSGDLLATGDDEACIIVWKLKTGSDPVEFPTGEEENFKEQWVSVKVLRGHLQDVYDLCWSADSKNLISGSVDNTAILWDVSTGKNMGILGEHKGFVQGVAWDPCGQYVATMSSDRVCRVYNATSRRVVAKLYKGLLPGVEAESKPTHFFHDDTLKSFFRRLTFTPDGELLIVPSGLIEESDKKSANSTLIFSRHCLQKPTIYLPSLGQYTVAVRCCPVLFTLRPMQSPPLFDLPYRVVIAVATQCSVVLYDTQHAAPFAFITKIHYTRLTDLSWSSDGRVLVVSSTDGYCSVITFAENELGTVYVSDKKATDKECDKSIKEKPDPTSKGEPTKKDEKSSKVNNKSDILVDTEDANMPFETNGAKEINKKVEASKEDPKNVPEIKDTTKLEVKETPMDVEEDFELMYDGTVTQPVLETKITDKDDKTEEKPETETVTPFTKHKETESVDKSAENLSNSPSKSESTTATQPLLTSPQAASSSGVNVTPTSGHKKTPRRVQLITLSSPKSKKQLLQ